MGCPRWVGVSEAIYDPLVRVSELTQFVFSAAGVQGAGVGGDVLLGFPVEGFIGGVDVVVVVVTMVVAVVVAVVMAVVGAVVVTVACFGRHLDSFLLMADSLMENATQNKYGECRR